MAKFSRVKSLTNKFNLPTIVALSTILGGCSTGNYSHQSDWLENMPKHSPSSGSPANIKGVLGEKIYNSTF